MKQLITFIGILILVGNSFSQNNYFVSNNGNDNVNLGSLNMPWQTINFSLTQLSAGDTLNILAGTYTGKIDCNVSGNSNQDIVIRNYNNANVVVSGATLNNYEYLFKIENQAYIEILGITFSNYQKLDAQGIVVINSSNISIKNNTFKDIDYATNAIGQTPNYSQNSQPIIVYGRNALSPITNLKIIGNTIYDCEVGYSECISVNGNVDGFEIVNNHLYNNTNIGIVAIGFEGECPDPNVDQARNGLIENNLVHDNPSAYAAAAGIYIDGAKSVVVENNISFNNDYGIEVGCENNGAIGNNPSASDILVRNNLIYNNKVTGIALGGYNFPTTGKVETTTIRNNTMFGNDTDGTYSGEMYISYIENSIIENNIFYANNTYKVVYIIDASTLNLNFDYNLYYLPSGFYDLAIEVNGSGYYEFDTYQNTTNQDLNSVFADPLFVNNSLTALDFHLQANSPAIDAGNPSFVADPAEIDIDGESRINNQIDCGADEYYTTTSVHIYLESNDINVYPNPFTDKVIIDGDFIPYQIEVYNSNGMVVTNYTGSSNPLCLNLNQLGSGLYFISIQHTSFSDVLLYKIIKE